MTGVASNYKCTADAAARRISISGFAEPGTVPRPANEVVKFVVQQSIQNPGAFIAPGLFSFLLVNKDGGSIDIGEFDQNSGSLYVESFITEFYAKINDTTAGVGPVTIDFLLRPNSKVPKDAYLVL